MSDAELVVLSQQGNLEAFNRLARKWDQGLYRFVHRTLGNAEEARDVSQESLIKAFQNIRRLRDPNKFRAWLHHIALNLCRDRHRAAKARGFTEAYEEGGPNELQFTDAQPADWAPDREAERASLAETLRGMLARLPLEQRTAILLREYHGFTSVEIAQITGVPAATVRTRIFYGLKATRRLMHERGITRESLGEGGGSR